MTNAVRIDLAQGSPEWEEYRRTCLNASELACAENKHPINSRRDMLRVYATGTPIEYSHYVKTKVFPRGHKVEADIRPIAEDKFNKDFIPKVYQLDGKYSASLDGIDPAGEETLEIKQYNEEMFEMVANGEMPEYHKPQVQQGLWITGAKRCIFAVANKEATDFVHVVVEPDLDYHEKIPRIWEKFEEDVANYTDVEQHSFLVEVEHESKLPVVRLSTEGVTVYTNLPTWFPAKKAAYEALSKELNKETTGQLYAVKQDFKEALPHVQLELKKLKEVAQPMIDQIAELKMIEKYLISASNECEKLLAAGRRAIRQEACDKAELELLDYLSEKSKGLGFELRFTIPNMMSMVNRTRDNDALASAIGAIVADSKIAIDREAESLLEKKRWFEETASEYRFLFDDLNLIIYTPTEHFQMTVELRIVKHKEQERIKAEAEAKAQAEREEKIRKEAEEKARREEQERFKVEAEAKAKAIAEVAQAMADAEEQAYREKLERENQAELEHAAAKAEQKRIVDHVDTDKKDGGDQTQATQDLDIHEGKESSEQANADYVGEEAIAPERQDVQEIGNVLGGEVDAPSWESLVMTIAGQYDVDFHTAHKWLVLRFSNIQQ